MGQPQCEPRVIGELLLHPLVVLCMLLWGFNDHFLKTASPSWLTGKLSDVCGLVVFPLFVMGLWQWVASLAGTAPPLGRRARILLLVSVGVVFAGINVSNELGEVYRCCYRALMFPLGVLTHSPTSVPYVAHTVDPSDLLALPSLWAAYLLSRPQRRSGLGRSRRRLICSFRARR